MMIIHAVLTLVLNFQQVLPLPASASALNFVSLLLGSTPGGTDFAFSVCF